MVFISNQSSDRSTDGQGPRGWLWGGGAEEKKRSWGSWKGRGGRTVGNAILRGRGAQKSLGLRLGRQQNPRRAG